jgi:hypothetical protein
MLKPAAAPKNSVGEKMPPGAAPSVDGNDSRADDHSETDWDKRESKRSAGFNPKPTKKSSGRDLKGYCWQAAYQPANERVKVRAEIWGEGASQANQESAYPADSTHFYFADTLIFKGSSAPFCVPGFTLFANIITGTFLVSPRHDKSAEIWDSFYEAPARLEGRRQLIRAAFRFDPAYSPKKAILTPHQHPASPTTSRDKIDIDPGRHFVGELDELLNNGQLRSFPNGPTWFLASRIIIDLFSTTLTCPADFRVFNNFKKRPLPSPTNKTLVCLKDLQKKSLSSVIQVRPENQALQSRVERSHEIKFCRGSWCTPWVNCNFHSHWDRSNWPSKPLLISRDQFF